MERVSVISGKRKNITIIAPHGVDDCYTIEIANTLAETLQCNAVINNGFQRSEDPDTLNDLANCNNRAHCLKDPVVKQEFLDPILKFVQNKKEKCYLFYIHGMNNKLDVSTVLGYGLGVQGNRFTMDEEKVHYLYHDINTNHTSLGKLNLGTVLGKGGGKYAARGFHNITQFFRVGPFQYHHVQSLQIEINSKERKDAESAKNFATRLAPFLFNVTNDQLTSGYKLTDQIYYA